MLCKHVLGCCALALVVAGCLIDDDDVCGAHQHHIKMDFLDGCVCDERAVPNQGGIGCHLCAEHEKVVGEACVCEDGYARANAGAACTLEEPSADAGASGLTEPGTSGQDMSCSASTDCAGNDATFCLTLQPPARCLVENCADKTHRCASDRECCVINVLPELAATGGLCVEKGACMAPGMVVTP